MKATDEQIVAAYEATRSLRAVGRMFGMVPQSVHERLVKLGRNQPINLFTDHDREYLKSHYEAYASTGKIGDLARKMGRTRQFLCRQARALGLTDQKRPKSYIAVWKYMPVDAAEVIWDDFKASSYGLGAYCTKKGFDDLGFSRRMKELFPDEYEHVIELKVPKSTKYRIGRAFEYRCRDHLKTLGYFVLRSPASRSPVDVVAYAHGTMLMVQCKRHGAIGVADWNAIFDLAASVGAKPILAVMHQSQRGISYFQMTGRKDGSRRAQPMVEFKP